MHKVSLGKHKDGSSIISVMVAFVILMLGILMVNVSIKTALKLGSQASAGRYVMEEAVLKYYTDRAAGTSVPFMQSFVLEPQNSVGSDLAEISDKGKTLKLGGSSGTNGPVAYEYTYQKTDRFGYNTYIFYYFGNS